MIDPSITSLIAAGVALLVGFGSVFINGRWMIHTQRDMERARALVRVLHIVELNGQGLQDRIFNLTSARREGRDPVTGEVGDPYAPQRRPVRPLKSEELAEAAALMAAYGTRRLDRSFGDWRESLDRIEIAFLNSELNYLEHGVNATLAQFERETADEIRSRIELGRLARDVLRGQRRQGQLTGEHRRARI